MKVKNLITTALFIAIIAVITMAVNIPIPGTRGYVNPSEAGVFLAVLVLRSPYAALAAGLGGALADLGLGYSIYAPASFLAKAIEALIFLKFIDKPRPPALVSMVLGVFAMVLSYFLYEWLVIYRNIGPALLGLIPNLGQGLFGIIIASLTYPLIKKALGRQ